MATGSAAANEVSVECYTNRDGTISCQRLSDGKWFTCARSVGGTSTCSSRDGEPITCTRTGGGVSSCTSEQRRPAGGTLPGISVF